MADKIRTAKINHVTAMVKDTARAMKFYNDLVGIKQIQSQVDNPEITWLQLESGIMLHLIETDERFVGVRSFTDDSWPRGIVNFWEIIAHDRSP